MLVVRGAGVSAVSKASSNPVRPAAPPTATAAIMATARANVGAKLRKEAERMNAAADLVEAGDDDMCFAMKHEVQRLERDDGR